MSNKIIIWSSSILLSLIGSFIYDSIKEIPLFSTIWNAIKWIWKSIFEFELKVWEIIILISVIYFIKKNN
jgi:hypothetical protein